VEICPEVFEMGEQFAELKVGIIPQRYEEAVRQSADECPVTAIIIE
jgi:ferredoxin